jgi:hypothetical protein
LIEGISGGYKSDQRGVGYEVIEQNNALPGTHRTSSQLQQQTANAEQKVKERIAFGKMGCSSRVALYMLSKASAASDNM